MKLNVETMLESYFVEHIQPKAAAPKRAEKAINALNSFFSKKVVARIDIPMCRAYRLHREHVTDSTVRRELGTLVAAVNHAVKWRRLTLAEVPSIELPPEGDPRRVWLYKDELATLLETAQSLDHRVFRFVQIAYHTGSRKEAIEKLTWLQIDLENKRVNLHTPGSRVTKKRRPIVPLSEKMVAELSEEKKFAVSGWVLISPHDIRRAFDRVAAAAGLASLPARGLREAGALTPHILRHSRATHLLQDGKQPWAVANLLGDSLTTVLKVYGHACPDYLEGIVT